MDCNNCKIITGFYKGDFGGRYHLIDYKSGLEFKGDIVERFNFLIVNPKKTQVVPFANIEDQFYLSSSYSCSNIKGEFIFFDNEAHAKDVLKNVVIPFKIDKIKQIANNYSKKYMDCITEVEKYTKLAETM